MILSDFLLSQCLKYKTDQQQDVKRMEKLNTEMFRMMIRGASGKVGDEGSHFHIIVIWHSRVRDVLWMVVS